MVIQGTLAATPVIDRLQKRAKSSQVRLLLLAPPHARIPQDFDEVYCARARHEELLAGMQRMRGRVYLQDGAIDQRQLSSDGRHRLDIDWESWHLLALDNSGAVCGCVRYRSHDSTACFQELWVRHSALANSSTWGGRFRAAVEADLQAAYSHDISYVEVGGWAIAPEYRCTTEAVRTALATYSLAQVLGGCIGITTATTRHCSSSILRRIGGSSLHSNSYEIPPYFDPQYNCEMEVLRFDSARPAQKYATAVERLRSDLVETPVICETPRRLRWSGGILENRVPETPEGLGLALQPA